MINAKNAVNRDDPFDLSRFTQAQEAIYERALAELKSGQKRTHWMWYIFPQLDGLGSSSMSKRYAIRSIEEAQQYLNHPILGARLLECTEAVLSVEGRSISEIFGYPDDLKLKSSMTLFASLPNASSAFVRILDTHYHGEHDVRTLQLLENLYF
ncbi:DUF1810 domain-containing protein [Chloroflexi bacterium TSY]|nr:DUF1810 domain-containing protein [Chloroflexi bacterium TSY]